jgi:ABC-type polysaccharide/polyol phosphate export permease
MNWNKTFRQTHRWVSIAFIMIVAVVTILAAGETQPAEWVFLLPLPPLAFLAVTGLYLFAVPYVARWRGRRHSDQTSAL